MFLKGASFVVNGQGNSGIKSWWNEFTWVILGENGDPDIAMPTKPPIKLGLMKGVNFDSTFVWRPFPNLFQAVSVKFLFVGGQGGGPRMGDL